MASNGKVLKVKKFRIVEVNIFEDWAIVIRSHLECQNYAQSTEILYLDLYSAD